MKPLVITATLASPVVMHPADGVTIDGVLLYRALLEERGEALLGPQPPPEVIAAESARPHPGVPLGVEERAGVWCYQASLGELVGHVGGEVHHVHRRFDDALALQGGHVRPGRVQLATGPLKPARLPRWSEVAEAVRWHAVGDLERVALLLRGVTHIGKQQNTGFGAVAAWDVQEGGAPDRWLVRGDGLPARAIPLAWGDGPGERRVAAVRPPYWLPQHRVECRV